MCTDDDIDEAVETPPQTTRARLRGEFIRRAKERKRDYTVDWVHLKLNDQAQRTVLCKDPFQSRDERVEKLIASSVAPCPPSGPATVTAILAERPGLQRVDTDRGRAYVLTQLTGPVAVGDGVVLNTTAVDLGLGTGGWHVVHWNLARDEFDEPGPGHIMKLRYTSLQVDTGAAEEHDPDDRAPTSAACRWSSAACTARCPAWPSPSAPPCPTRGSPT